MVSYEVLACTRIHLFERTVGALWNNIQFSLSISNPEEGRLQQLAGPP